jgi:tellurite resistance protein TehA-like permease
MMAAMLCLGCRLLYVVSVMGTGIVGFVLGLAVQALRVLNIRVSEPFGLDSLYRFVPNYR